MALSSVSYVLKEPNGRNFTIRGTGTTIADAQAEASAKLALTVGTGVRASKTESMVAVNGGGGGSYSDVDLILRRGEKTVSIHLENVANSFAETVDGVATGKLDPDAGAAFAAAYKDGEGVGGYIYHDSAFVN